jgi:DNA-binding response OmpR family regulator
MSQTILMIDDNDKTRFILKDMLSDEGYNVVTACNGDEANKKMDESMQTGKSFNLLLVDLSVPGFDPIKFIKIYKNMHRILVVSAYMDSYNLKGILDEKWKIRKPFDNNILIARVKERLEAPMNEEEHG